MYIVTYCSNIHPGETWSQVFANLEQYIPPLKARLAPKEPFGIGLRLSDLAAKELLQGNALEQFQSWLSDRDLYVFTLNGFPFGGFHHQVVKDKVYAPDWETRSRLDYTLNLTKILAVLLPEGSDGGISTLPLSYKLWHTNKEIIFKEGSINLASVTAEMTRIHEKTGKLLHLDLEPEPDGLLENTVEVIDDYQFLQSTQDDLVAVLNLLQDNPVCNHLEIETYTWDVLPPQMKLDLLASIKREYEWVLKFGNW